MPTKSQAIANFLRQKTHNDLANLYALDMECQVNVAQDGGNPIQGDYEGRIWRGWTDGLTTWKAIRIPFNAASRPTFFDSEIKFDLAAHAEGIGLTGWDWKAQVSRWVAFDLDAIIGHSDKHAKKLSDLQMQEVIDAAYKLPFVTIRYSTSGRGRHLYIFLETPEPTANHVEHAALARAILGQMAAITGFDFRSSVDTCGGNMWIWHRKMEGTNGLKLIREGKKLQEVPQNWRDHIVVSKGKRRKALPSFLEEKSDETIDTFEELCGQYTRVPLDDEHRNLINYLKDHGHSWWWDQDHHMLVTHTAALKEAHSFLVLKGIFETVATGREKGADINCFMFPLRRGAWVVRRYSPGFQEHPSWDQDGQGFTRCYFNRDADLKTAARTAGGLEHPSGGYVFDEAENAIRAAGKVGVHFELPPRILQRKTKIKEHKDGRMIIEIEHDAHDDAGKMHGWLFDKGHWKRIFNTQISTPSEPETGNYDDIVRHLVTEAGDDYGWVIKSGDIWLTEPFAHVKAALESMGLSAGDTKTVMGQSIFKCWTIVNMPFQPEYPGDRRWNRNAAQLKVAPTTTKTEFYFPSWKKILSHVGAGLDSAIKENPWAKANGIQTGEDYLRCWIASLIKEPLEPLPYLFLYGPQNSGKSILHEALSVLFNRGVQRADVALLSQQGFNAELETAILCIVEETDLRKNLQAYNRIKDWVTSRLLPIHRKMQTPYMIPNTTHWIQTANDYNACPVFSGDSRITMINVASLDPIDLVPKKQLLSEIEKEASDFLASILAIELPPSNDRLNVPVITTEEKLALEQINKSHLEVFIDEECHHVPGGVIKLSDFYEKFIAWLDPSVTAGWSKRRVGHELKSPFVKGRLMSAGAQFYIGNISFTPPEKGRDYVGKYVVVDGSLVMVKNDP